MLIIYVNSKRNFYQPYPNTNCTTKNMPSIKKKRGVFDLLKLLGIEFNRGKMNNIISFFGYRKIILITEVERNQHKRCYHRKNCHIAYSCESVYTLEVSNKMNISMNPGFKSQLTFYGQ